MKISRKTHLELRLQNSIFTLLILGLGITCAWISTEYSTEFDWTYGKRNTLTEASEKILQLLPSPVKVISYARENRSVRDPIEQLVSRYSRLKPDLTLEFSNPDTHPDEIRQLGIHVDGEILIQYQGRNEKIQEVNEAAFSNALQRLARAQDQQISFLEGHGERSASGEGAADLGQFSQELKRKGLQVNTLNLAKNPVIPETTRVLVLAGARSNLLPGELKLIQNYLNEGRALLWLTEPDETSSLKPLLQMLGIQKWPGVVVDASTQLFGIDDPSFVLISEYTPHPATMGLQSMTLFPGASALAISKPENQPLFEYDPILKTLARSWTETSAIEGQIAYDEKTNEQKGPLTLGFAMTRIPPQNMPSPAGSNEHPVSHQRIAVIGDGDFLSNAYLGNSGNLSLGSNLVNWLAEDDRFIAIPAHTLPDQTLALSAVASTLIALGFLFLMPVSFVAAGLFIWLSRRGR